MPLQYVNSEKGKPKLINDGHLFVKDKISDEKIIWKCEKFFTLKCRARCHTKNDIIVLKLGNHNHTADAACVAVAKVLNSIKDRARSTLDGPHRILAESSIGLTSAVAAQMPAAKTLKRTINRIRADIDGSRVFPSPLNRAELIIPEELKLTHKKELFLLYDSGVGDVNRMLIFSTSRNIGLLASSNHWYADGTFKTVPLIFEQLYTIHGIKNNCVTFGFCVTAQQNGSHIPTFISRIKIISRGFKAPINHD